MASYQGEREEFIARMTKEGLAIDAILTLLRCATSINRYAELACSSEAADRDRVKCPAWVKYGPYVDDVPDKADPKVPCLCDCDHDGIGRDGNPASVHTKIPRYRLLDYRAEQRAIAAVPAEWRVITEGDPRGYTLRVIPPSMAWHIAPTFIENTPTQYGVYRKRELHPRKLVPNPAIKLCATELEAQDYIRHNCESIGVPPGPSRLRF